MGVGVTEVAAGHGAGEERAVGDGARERPDVRILCLTPNLNTARRQTLTWGVHAVHGEDAHNFADMVQRAVRVARKEELARQGERLVITAGVPFGTPGATNILRIAYV